MLIPAGAYHGPAIRSWPPCAQPYSSPDRREMSIEENLPACRTATTMQRHSLRSAGQFISLRNTLQPVSQTDVGRFG